jgi:serine/threonine protein phosphatase PrpC
MRSLSFGFSENVGPPERQKFDCIRFNKNHEHFVLCDGANSTPWGGHAAQMAACQLLLSLDPSNVDEQAINMAFSETNLLLLDKLVNGAATGLSVILNAKGVYCASCGDSLIEVYKDSTIDGWTLTQSSKLDLLPDNRSPSQLIGSTAFDSPSLFYLPPKGRYVILMMSDGTHKFTTQYDRQQNIGKIKGGNPSNQDMQFISAELCNLAVQNGSHDDASAICVWIKYS